MSPAAAPRQHVRALPSGDLALIGDVHGELGALRQLLSRLDPSLTLVYVGDIADRGPDSPGVINLVHRQIASGQAHCVLGNHELSILRFEYKKYNAWFFPDRPDWQPVPGGPPVLTHRVLKSKPLQRIWRFFDSLPVALEREDLRVVHAAWSDHHIEALRRSDLSAPAIFDQGPLNDVREPSCYRNYGDGMPPTDSHRSSAWELKEQAAQNDNPIRYSTSGGERVVEHRGNVSWLGGKWRVLAREPWWNSYQGSQHVVVGHYARRLHGEDQPLFRGVSDATAPLGPAGRVWCIDYGIGQSSVGGLGHRLAALIWRDGGASRELLFHTGERIRL